MRIHLPLFALLFAALACSPAAIEQQFTVTDIPPIDVSSVRPQLSDFPEVFSEFEPSELTYDANTHDYPGFDSRHVWGFYNNRTGREMVFGLTGQLTGGVNTFQQEVVENPEEWARGIVGDLTDKTTNFMIDVGDEAAGITVYTNFYEVANTQDRVDVVSFTRGSIMVVMLSVYPDTSIPLAPIDPLAQIVDQRAQDLLASLPE